MKYINILLMVMGACAVTSCAAEDAAVPTTPSDIFYEHLTALCGNAYSGKLVSSDAQDAAFAEADMVMHIAECDKDQIAIPFHVEADQGQWNRSRTWVIHKNDGALALHHVHRHEDGEEDIVSRYGGRTTDKGTDERQQFPVDQFSQTLFADNDLSVSTTNIWAVEVNDEIFAYELKREGRFFRVEFDLTQSVEAPPSPWGGSAPIL